MTKIKKILHCQQKIHLLSHIRDCTIHFKELVYHMRQQINYKQSCLYNPGWTEGRALSSNPFNHMHARSKHGFLWPRGKYKRAALCPCSYTNCTLRAKKTLNKQRSLLDFCTPPEFIHPGRCPHQLYGPAGSLCTRVRIWDPDGQDTISALCQGKYSTDTAYETREQRPSRAILHCICLYSCICFHPTEILRQSCSKAELCV